MELKFTRNDILSMERFYRVHLINSLSGYKSSHLIGTVSPNGVYNLAIFNSVIHIGANPPMMGVLIRPHTIPRHTYENLKRTGTFTINHVPIDRIKDAHQTSAKYDASVSEFEACGFTPQLISGFDSPFVGEASIKIGLTYAEEHLIAANQTILVVGQIEHLYLPQSALAPSGHVDIDQCGSAAVCGLDTYYEGKQIFRLSYARPNEEIREI